MAELHAVGPLAGQRWRQVLPVGPITLGREDLPDWEAAWDKQISRLHATLHWQDGRLLVRRLPTGRNPIFYRGTATDEFRAAPGEAFVIGQTTFRVVDPEASAIDLPTPLTELTCSAKELRDYRYDDADERIEVLAALPGVIRLSPGEEELETRVAEVLLRGIPRAQAAAVVRLSTPRPDEKTPVEVRTVRTAGGIAAAFRPSRRLVLEAIQHRRQGVLHVWQGGGASPEFTETAGFDWALCMPLPDDPAPGWGLYLAGRLPGAAGGAPVGDGRLKGDLKFAEVVAEVFGALRQVCDLQRRQGQLSRFLSRPVLAALAGKDMEEVLQPRQATVTVLFCDLRGSCRIAEEGQHDLLALWNHVGAALGIMSSSILDQDGVIGDFQGDAAMGFWGWPLAADDQIERAARAALAIRRRFAQAAREPGHPLAGFACGLGLAHGNAIAGRLGTPDQFKIDVFGPVVNLAARLEGMTKRFGVAVLTDEDCGRRLAGLTATLWARTRPLARVQPYGMTRRLTVYELLPAVVEPDTPTDRELRDYEVLLSAFLAGRWTEARPLLERLPRQGPPAFLARELERYPAGPPHDWDGTVVLEGK
jgi:adenylate cyclase